jgi:hypothetical protein
MAVMKKPVEPALRLVSAARGVLRFSAAAVPLFLLGLAWWWLSKPGSSAVPAGAFLGAAVLFSASVLAASGWMLALAREAAEPKRGRELELYGVRTSPDPIVQLNEALCIVGLNPAAESKFGHTGAAMSGMPFTFLMPRQQPQPAASLAAAPARPEPPRAFLSLDTQTSARRLAMRTGTRLAHLVQPLLGFTEIAMEALDRDHPVRADLQEIGRSSSRVVLLAQSLEIFGGGRRTQPEPVELNEFLDRIEPELRFVLQPSTTLEFRKSAQPVSVLADPGLARTALQLLLCNAEEAAAGVTVSVERGGLVVSDSGPGIPDEVRVAMFKPLTSSKSPERGVGLGLHAARAAMRLQHGDLLMQSTGEGGTVLALSFPAVPTANSRARLGLADSLATAASA